MLTAPLKNASSSALIKQYTYGYDLASNRTSELVGGHDQLYPEWRQRSYQPEWRSEPILKLRQGVGRLIRTKSDHGIVVILDNRIVTRPYGRAFLQALPECPVKVI